MSEVRRIAEGLTCGIDGDPWHGPATLRVLDGIDARAAAAHPLPGGHSIWETVLHMTAWTREVLRRLELAPPGLPLEGDWPEAGEATPEAWTAAVRDLRSAHEELAAELMRMPESRLWEIVGGAARDRSVGVGVTFYAMLHGLAQHDVYHTAQIATLRRVIDASRSAPA